jgi:hypothetical protein
MPQISRRASGPATLSLILTALPFLTASAMLGLAYGARWNGFLLSFVQFTGPFMLLLIFVGSGALLYAATKAARVSDWRLILSALFLVGAVVNFALYSMHA